MSKTVMSLKEFAEDIGVSVPTAYIIAKRADFPAIRVSDRRIIIPIAAYHKWLEDQVNAKLVQSEGSGQYDFKNQS